MIIADERKRHCDQCNQRKPMTGFRCGQCAECFSTVVASRAAAAPEVVAACLHLTLRSLRSADERRHVANLLGIPC